MKRTYYTTSNSQQYGLSSRGKRRRSNSNTYQNIPRGLNQRQMIKPYKLYVPRTPGGQIVSERKYYDTTLNGGTISSVVSNWLGAENDPVNIDTLFAPIQGNDISDREGRNCYVHNITVRGSIKSDDQTAQTLVDANQIFRIILVLDKQTNGAKMEAEDLITSGSGAPSLYDFQNTANFGRFQILKDRIIEHQPCNIAGNTSGTFWQGSQRKHFKLKHTFNPPLRICFNSTNGGTVSDIVDNSFHIICGKESANIGANLYYQSRVSFTG